MVGENTKTEMAYGWRKYEKDLFLFLLAPS